MMINEEDRRKQKNDNQRKDKKLQTKRTLHQKELSRHTQRKVKKSITSTGVENKWKTLNENILEAAEHACGTTKNTN